MDQIRVEYVASKVVSCVQCVRTSHLYVCFLFETIRINSAFSAMKISLFASQFPKHNSKITKQ